MHVRELHLVDFRSWANLDLQLSPGVTVFSGPNGHGKTNIVEALGYLAHLGSHRINTDAALVREKQQVANVSATAVNQGRELTASIAIRPHAANKAQINRTSLATQRELLGIVRTTLFAPEDLALVRGEPEQRRNFLDTIMVARYPRLAGVKADYDRVLRQRNALLKSTDQDPFTLEVWDGQLAALGGQLMSARVQIVHDLAPHLQSTYARLAPESRPAHLAYSSTIDAQLADAEVYLGTSNPDVAPALLSPQIAEAALLQGFADKRDQELERRTTLLGPHRDDVVLMLGTQPAKGYASHGESWSFALSLRLAAFFMQRGDGAEPIVILDDVFAELDSGRRARLVELISDAEQVLITAAVDQDIPEQLRQVATVFSVEAHNGPDGRVSSIDSKVEHYDNPTFNPTGGTITAAGNGINYT